MIVAGSPTVLGDIHAPNPEFSLVEITVAVRDRRLAQPYGLDLRTHEHDARDPLLDNFVIEGRAFVPYVNILIIGHIQFLSFSAGYLCSGTDDPAPYLINQPQRVSGKDN